MTKIDEFIDESKKLIGKDVVESPPVNTVVDREAIVKYASALGSQENPLFIDPDYATDSKYGCLIPPQTFLAAVRCPASEGAYRKKDYGLAKHFIAAEFEFFDVIRCGDRITPELTLTEIYEKPYLKKDRAVHLVTEGCYWNQHKELVGTVKATVSMVPFKRGEEMLLDRDIYRYTADDVKRISKDTENSLKAGRGNATLYWDEVNEGDKLTPVVKGPVGLGEQHAWRAAAIRGNYSEEVIYKRALKEPGNMRVNPTTNWPYWHLNQAPEDHFSSAVNGMPQPWNLDGQRVCLAEDLLVKWMGDDAFIRRLNVDLLRPFIYMDTNFYAGEVVDKYIERLQGETYKAVDIKIDVTNQLGETTGTGEATIYLPSWGQEVKLPLPC